jgi:cytochrome c-type biogenesis protein
MKIGSVMLSIILIFLLVITFVNAEEKYSFEKSESMKDLIKWRDYGPDAFLEAEKENKPIFLLLTAPSWCYWCQVYESEDYLFNAQVVGLINEKFIPIYVDADKRQDITRKYIEGGWPSTTVFSPSMERIFGFSGPRPVDNMLSNLNGAVEYVKDNRGKLKIKYDYEKEKVVRLDDGKLRNFINNYFNYIYSVYDSEYGGFGFGQKFPQGRTLDIALEMYEKSGDSKWLDLVLNTFDNQYTKVDELESNYNLFDPVEGGFHRYGTTRFWSPPHYEKMLYDNARLLRAYYHLLQIDSENQPDSRSHSDTSILPTRQIDSEIQPSLHPLDGQSQSDSPALENGGAKSLTHPDKKLVSQIDRIGEVVTKTNDFIIREYYDNKDGGFYGNSDVHGEDSYYAKNPRPSGKPRVEKTKYTEWNAEAILTYLYLYEKSGDEKYKEIVVNSLNFYLGMYDENGAYHYYKDGKKGVQGNLLDNSYLLLAFVEGYRVIEDDSYLVAAKEIADFSLDNLYDWNSGGFFERNSKDKSGYAPGENIDLGKPSEENGVMALGMLRLYLLTEDIKYLNAGVKTVALQLDGVGGLDRGYYFVKVSELIDDNGLLGKFDSFEEEIKLINKERLEGFWLNVLLESQEKGFVVSDFGVDQFDGPLLLLLIVSLIAGFISFASPCTMPILPAFVAFTLNSKGKNIKGMTFCFFLGLSIVFVLIGVVIGFVGGLLNNYIVVYSRVAGIFIILLGLMLIFGKGFSGLQFRYKPIGYVGSFLFGGVFGFAWTPCVGPILVAILLLASTGGSFVVGGLMLFSYTVGLSVPLIVFSSYLGRIDNERKLWKFIKGKMIVVEYSEGKKFMVHSSSLISGVLFVVLGWLIFSGQLFLFNQYVVDTGLQRWLFSIEEKVLGWIN